MNEAVGVEVGGAVVAVIVGGRVPVRLGVRDGVLEGVDVRWKLVVRATVALIAGETLTDGVAEGLPLAADVVVTVGVAVAVSEGVGVIEAVGVAVKCSPGWKGVTVGSSDSGRGDSTRPATAAEVAVGDGNGARP